MRAITALPEVYLYKYIIGANKNKAITTSAYYEFDCLFTQIVAHQRLKLMGSADFGGSLITPS